MTDERQALASVEKAVATTIANAEAEHDKFFEWINMFQDRVSSVSGIAQDTLFCEEAFEDFDEYYDDLWRRFLSGVDPVDYADDLIKDWPSAQRQGEGTQSAEEFRTEWREAQARFDAMYGPDA